MQSNKDKKLMTKAGHAKLAAEQEHLLRIERPKVVAGVATAAAEGDRSENAEYIYGKKRLREIDKRLRYLGILLKDVRLIEASQLSGTTVCFGSTIKVLDDQGRERTYTIVGEGEADYKEQSISYKSPVARALQGKRVGDVVLVHTPAGEVELEIMALYFGERLIAEA